MLQTVGVITRVVCQDVVGVPGSRDHKVAIILEQAYQQLGIPCQRCGLAASIDCFWNLYLLQALDGQHGQPCMSILFHIGNDEMMNNDI